MSDLPVVCTLTPATRATRQANLLGSLVRRADEREETADGFRFGLPSDVLPVLASTVEAERQCCRFLRFEIVVEPDNGPIRLSLSGPPGTREFVSTLLES